MPARKREPGVPPSQPVIVSSPFFGRERRDGNSESATNGSGSFQFRAGARTGSRAVAAVAAVAD